MSRKIISVLSEKGGVGKTTLSTNISHCLKHYHNKNVLLIDGDPQGSSRDWHDVNEGEIVPVLGMDRPTIDKDIKNVCPSYERVIIDGAPAISSLFAKSIKISDLVLIPVQPSPLDLWATSNIVKIIKERQDITDGKLKAAFVVSRAIKNTKLSGELFKILKEFDLPILEHGTTQKIIYPSSISEGKTVIGNKDKNAEIEIKQITQEIEDMLLSTTPP